MAEASEKKEAYETSKRYKTLPLSQIDSENLSKKITQLWRSENDKRQEFLVRRERWTSNWRDLTSTEHVGPWENSSNFKIPITLTFGKAIHARLWQLFSDPANFFGVKARNEAFQDRENTVKDFMQYIWTEYLNGKKGVRDVIDEWLNDVVYDGSGYLKLYYQRDVHTYMEVVPVTEIEESKIFDAENLTGRISVDAKVTEKEEERKEVVETPYIKRVLTEDIIMPMGQSNPQSADWVCHRVFMTDESMKARAYEGKFNPESVEESLEHRSRYLNGEISDEIKRTKADVDGYEDADGYFEGYHSVLEWYGKAYIKKEIEGDEDEKLSEHPEEIIAWVHQGSGKTLGWTYLYRVSPSGIRPLFKGDFIKFNDRTQGVGAAEVLDPIQGGIDAIYNLRQDNGVLASTPFGFYRASSGLKPDKFKVEPGLFVPTDDPQGDVRVIQMPFLANFGYQEEDRLYGYSERLLNISDINLGRAPQKVGTFRTASGAQSLQQEGGIQLEIHFDRIARCMNSLLQALFILARERMPQTLYYRITGENGNPIFGQVSREDLKGNFDFEINIDILGESRIEAQQKATMMMQTLLNPAFMQTGIVNQTNLYHLARNFLQKNRIRRIDDFVTPPQPYSGPVVSPNERVYRIVVNAYMNPPVEQTVRLDENHENALAVYEGFKQSDNFGLLTNDGQLQALDRLIQAHQQMMTAQQAGGNPNMAGMQTPRDGFGAMGPNPDDQGTLGSPIGEPNGPVI